MILLILCVVVVVGLLMYVLASNAKASEVGRIMFFAALLVLLLALSHGGILPTRLAL